MLGRFAEPSHNKRLVTRSGAAAAMVIVVAAMGVITTACGVGAVNNAAPPGDSATHSEPSTQGATTGGTTAGGTTAGGTTGAPTTTASPQPAASPNTSVPQTGNQATFTGTVSQNALTPKSAIFALVAGSDGNQTLAVKLSDQADDCTEVTDNAHRPNSNTFWLRAVGTTFAGQAFRLAGASGDTTDSSATFYALDASCSDTLATDASWATAGSVSFTTVSAQSVTGTYKATMGTQGDQVSGTFTATSCAALSTLITAPDTVRSCQ